MKPPALTLPLPAAWQTTYETLFFAYQPIVNVHTGRVFGFEALLRGYQEAGFDSIAAVVDGALDQGCLHNLDLMLRGKALERFAELPNARQLKLFYNLDNRLLSLSTVTTPHTDVIMRHYGLANGSLCFEVSERHHLSDEQRREGAIHRYRQRGFRIAVDDFGSGYSGLQLLYHAQPDIIKLDRFLIAGVDNDPKKRLFVSSVVNMAHIMGMVVVAEGIETEDEFRLCRDVGADYAQGFLIGRPTAGISEVPDVCDAISSIVGSERRNRSTTQDIIARKMEYLEPISLSDPITDVLDRFRQDQNATFFPVVSADLEPVGVLRETDLKRYVYSPFGFSLLQNRNYPKAVQSFTSKAPIVDIHSRMEKVVEAYAINKDAEAVIITDNGRYCGLLRSRALIETLNERRVEQARDQNPLSGLPGNHTISEFLSHALARADGDGYTFVYVDFDHFKVFNDTYGFRLGDRAIMVFADMLRGLASRTGVFAGHIGGDDFFLGVPLEKMSFDEVHEELRLLLKEFAETARGLYTPKDRSRGYVIAKGRDGRRKQFPLLSASAAALCVSGAAKASITTEQLSEQIASLKLLAKNRSEGLAVMCLNSQDLPVGAEETAAVYRG
ncbi:MAG: EAL domain-containing protein [Spirochaetaceae bacterium]